MKKIACTVGAVLMVASGGLLANVHHVNNAGFTDNFHVTFGAGVSPVVSYVSQSGTIFNKGNVTCQGNICTYAITDNDTWLSSGTVTYLMGDQTKQGPYCTVTMRDGALVNTASMSSNCYGASPTPMYQNDKDYQFSINKD